MSRADVVGAVIDSGVLPEAVLRAGIRAVCALRLREQRTHDNPSALVQQLRSSEIAIATAMANTQHYEVPAAFFRRVLGPHIKYSACYWPPNARTLGDAEIAMLELTAQRAGIADGQAILDLGCGWGSFSLWAAARFPNSHITAISNSGSQRAFVEARAAERGLTNLRVLTGDVRVVDLPAASFDRVVSIEMFEHMRNYELLLRRIRGWLRPGGALFVHIFAHARFAYAYDDNGGTDWMAREFFTGGLMPSTALLRSFQDDLTIVDEWRVGGTHYARTAEAWHENLLAHRDELAFVLGDKKYVNRWRVFFLACAELFAYRGGSEWLVAHYKLEPR